MSLTDLNIRIATNGRQCNYWHMAAIKIEIKCLWKKPLNSSGYLFVVQRYFNPIAIIFTFVTLFDDLPVSCKTLSNIRQGILIIAQLVVTLPLVCFRILYHDMIGKIFMALAGAAVAWLMIFIYDVLLFGLMVQNVFKTRKELHMIHRLKFRASLRVILLRDGAMYFGVMTLVNLANILTYYFISDLGVQINAEFTSSCCLIPRIYYPFFMIINLVQIATRKRHNESNQYTGIRILSNLHV
ncbi:hypothetical protein F5876DRAFT_67037 [Lentinula aff. lateritia]|uniref:Uncharacterized protein n=1 Tax=Lentinula aff. lateritia TaxID=2804960 RepID=A0ACC1TVG6_9AGAR|nr:hypothetical protein F5876DRAFT_67037 [Lentinula aff. lateritia]